MEYVVEPQVETDDGSCSVNVICPKVLCVGNCPIAACELNGIEPCSSKCTTVCGIN